MGGLLTTCWLTQVGAPGVDGDEVLGIHGRISHLPAESVNVHEAWQTEWKMMGQQDYVVAIEPGNCIPEGRLEARKNNRLQRLKPGQSYEIEYEIGVLEGIEAIDNFVSSCE